MQNNKECLVFFSTFNCFFGKYTCTFVMDMVQDVLVVYKLVYDMQV